MNEVFSANILGINASNHRISGLASKSGSNSGEGFAKAMDSAMGVSGAQSIVDSLGNSMGDTLQQLSSSYDLGERETLAEKFRDAVVSALQGNGYEASAGASPDQIVMDGQTYDILSSLNTPGAKVDTQFIQMGGSEGAGGVNTASGTAQEVLFATGKQHNDLVQKINNSTTLDERMAYVDQLRDIIVDALNKSGHNAYDYGKHDKIVVNGNLIDFLRASNGVGMNTEVQWLDHGPAVNHGITPPGSGGSGTGSGTDYTSAIFAAGAKGGTLLNQISNSVDLEERRALANSFQEMMVAALKEQGFDAQVHTDPDKITLNGVTFDVIRSLNTPGAHASLQALRVV